MKQYEWTFPIIEEIYPGSSPRVESFDYNRKISVCYRVEGKTQCNRVYIENVFDLNERPDKEAEFRKAVIGRVH